MSSIKPSHVDHRDGSGHLDPEYEARLRGRAHDRARRAQDLEGRAFVSATSSTDSSAAESGQEFVWTVTSGIDAGEPGLDVETSEERGGPFVESNARLEFAYGTDESNPPGSTREPFPTS